MNLFSAVVIMVLSMMCGAFALAQSPQQPSPELMQESLKQYVSELAQANDKLMATRAQATLMQTEIDRLKKAADACKPAPKAEEKK